MDALALLQALVPKAAAAVAANAPASQRQLMLRTRLSKSFKTFGGDPAGRPITRAVKQWCMTDTSLELDTALLSDLSAKGLDQVIPEIGLKRCSICLCVFLILLLLLLLLLLLMLLLFILYMFVVGCSCAMCSRLVCMSCLSFW